MWPEGDAAVDLPVEDGVCEAGPVHGTTVADIRRLLPDADTLQAEAERLRAVADPTRLKVGPALSRAGLRLCEIASLAGATQTRAWQHHKILRAHRSARFTKHGRTAVCRLADPSPAARPPKLSRALGEDERDERQSL